MTVIAHADITLRRRSSHQTATWQYGSRSPEPPTRRARCFSNRSRGTGPRRRPCSIFHHSTTRSRTRLRLVFNNGRLRLSTSIELYVEIRVSGSGCRHRIRSRSAPRSRDSGSQDSTGDRYRPCACRNAAGIAAAPPRPRTRRGGSRSRAALRGIDSETLQCSTFIESPRIRPMQ